MPKDPFAAAAQHIAHERRALRKDRTGDYRRAMTMTDALFGNIMGDVRKARGRLTAGNARDLAAIQRLMARSRQGVGATHAAMLQAGGHTAGADYAQQAFGGATAAARGGVTGAAGQAQAGQMAASGGQTALDMIRGTVKATGNAADYAASQALSARAQQDVATTGAQQHDLDMARIQYAQQQAMEKQQEAFQMQMAQFQAQQARQQSARDFHYSMQLQQANLTAAQNAKYGGYGSDINSLSNATASALRAMQSIGADNIQAEYAKYVKAQTDPNHPPTDMTSWLAQTAAGQIGVGGSDPAMPLIARLAGTFIAHDGLGGPNTRMLNADIITHLLQAYPQFRGTPEKMLLRTVAAALKASISDIHAQKAAAVANPNAAVAGPDGGSGIVPGAIAGSTIGGALLGPPGAVAGAIVGGATAPIVAGLQSPDTATFPDGTPLSPAQMVEWKRRYMMRGSVSQLTAEDWAAIKAAK